MSRTFRHRKTLPKNWVARDNGVTYLKGERLELHETPWENRVYYRREKKYARKMHERQYRVQVKSAIYRMQWDNIPRHRRTSGWLTW